MDIQVEQEELTWEEKDENLAFCSAEFQGRISPITREESNDSSERGA